MNLFQNIERTGSIQSGRQDRSARLYFWLVVLSLSLFGNTGLVNAALTEVGPLSPNAVGNRYPNEALDNGFPLWYRDANGQALSLCLNTEGVDPTTDPPTDPTFCVVLADPTAGFDNALPLSMPVNFPPEAFYFVGDATIDMSGNGGGTIRLRLALEAAFFGGDAVDGDQIVFSRIRIRSKNTALPNGCTYRFTHPYGTVDLISGPIANGKQIDYTLDESMIPPPPGATGLDVAVDTVLTWDSGLPIVDSQGNQYVGNPNFLNTITGSPLGTNYFRIEGPLDRGNGICPAAAPLLGVPGSGTPGVTQDEFSIAGQIAPAALIDDTDADGIVDGVDNCSDQANGPLLPDAGGNSQFDADWDAYGNRCDTDLNNDNITNFADFLILRGDWGSSGPVISDIDGSGIVNFADFLLLRGNWGALPGPSGWKP